MCSVVSNLVEDADAGSAMLVLAFCLVCLIYNRRIVFVLTNVE